RSARRPGTGRPRRSGAAPRPSARPAEWAAGSAAGPAAPGAPAGLAPPAAARAARGAVARGRARAQGPWGRGGTDQSRRAQLVWRESLHPLLYQQVKDHLLPSLRGSIRSLPLRRERCVAECCGTRSTFPPAAARRTREFQIGPPVEGSLV
ncbi:unnamed protein product, partial [Heterosigma akashiwo]